MNKRFGAHIRSQKSKNILLWFGRISSSAGRLRECKNLPPSFGRRKNQQTKIESANLWLKTSEFGLTNQKSAGQYQPRMLSDTVNCFVMQYFPVLTADEQQLFFTRRNGITGNDTEDLVVATKIRAGAGANPFQFRPISTQWKMRACTVSADGRQIIFTSCRGRKGFGGCDLFMSVKQGDEWSEPKILAGVNSNYWESQPALAADGRDALLCIGTQRRTWRQRHLCVIQNEKGEWVKLKFFRLISILSKTISLLHSCQWPHTLLCIGWPHWFWWLRYLCNRTDWQQLGGT